MTFRHALARIGCIAAELIVPGDLLLREQIGRGKMRRQMNIPEPAPALRDLRDKKSQCAVGEGAMPVRGIFAQLVKMKYEGYVNLEYEIDASDPMSGMRASFAYQRGVVAGMKAG